MLMQCSKRLEIILITKTEKLFQLNYQGKSGITVQAIKSMHETLRQCSFLNLNGRPKLALSNSRVYS